MTTYHYTECGLDYVWLENGFTHMDTPYGPGTAVKAADKLLSQLALYVARKPSRLSGREFHYLRAEMSMPPEDAAQAHGVSEHLIHLWERGRRIVPKPHDMLQRLLHLRQAAGHESLRSALDRVTADERVIHQRIIASIDDDGWHLKVEEIDQVSGEAAVET